MFAEDFKKRYKDALETAFRDDRDGNGKIINGLAQILITSALKSDNYIIADDFLKIYRDSEDDAEMDYQDMLGRVLLKEMMKYNQCTEEHLEWLFEKGVKFNLNVQDLETAISNWNCDVLEAFFKNRKARYKIRKLGDYIRSYEREAVQLWLAASNRVEPVKFYELLLKSGVIPSPDDYVLAAVIEECPKTVDIKWFVTHGCNPNPESRYSFIHGERTQPVLAQYVCNYCDSRDKKYYTLVDKMLAAGANPNTQIGTQSLILKYHGAYNIMDVAVDSANEKMMDLLRRYKAEPNDLEARKNHYIETMETKLGLE